MASDTRLSKGLRILLGALALVGVLGIVVVRVALGSQAVPLATPTPIDTDLPHRGVSGDVESPTISSIDSPNPTCYRPVAGTGACFIQWGYLYVSAASGSYVVSMTVTIGDRIRAYHSGFFQPSMYIPADMTAPGYRVDCGPSTGGGSPGWGKTYTYQIRARETGGLTTANYGAVTCPADIARLFLPLIRRQ